MRKKKTYLCIFSLLLLFLILQTDFSFLTAQAEETQDATSELWENIADLIAELDLTALQEYLSSTEFFSNWNIGEKILEFIGGGECSYENFFQVFYAVFLNAVQDFLPSYIVICAIALTCGLLNAIKSNWMQDSVSDVIFYAGYCAVLAVVLSGLYPLFNGCLTCMRNMRKQMEIVFPILLTLMAAGGGSVSVGIFRPTVAFLCGGISSVLTEIVIPLTVVIIVFQMIEGLNANVKVKGFVSFFKSVNKWLIGLSASIFGIFITVQGLTSATYDGISLRAAKYAISNSIPIIGGFLSGGFDLVMAGSVLIKNSVGVIGIILLLFSVLGPITELIGFSLSLRFAAAICEPLGEERISRFLTSLSDATGFLIASLLCFAFLYFLTVVLLICSAGVMVV